MKIICWRLAALLLLAALAACSGHSTTGPYFQGGYVGQGNYAPPGPPDDPWGPYIREAAARFSVPQRWIREVIRQESGGRQYAGGGLTTSGAGAMGLMQIMPETYAILQQRYALGPDPYDPHDNILAGAAYIKEMYRIYGSPGFLAAYNAGPNRVDSYLSGAGNLPNETVNYLASVAPRLGNDLPMSGPLAVFAGNGGVGVVPPGYGAAYGGGSYAAASYAPTPAGCDPDAAYDPSRPCTPRAAQVYAAAAPAYVPPADSPVVAMPVVASAGDMAGCNADAAYDPNQSCTAGAPMAAPRFVQPALATLPVARPLAAPAMAAPGGAWSIQVGAFSSPVLARAIAAGARSAVPDLLGHAGIIAPRTTPFGGVVLYRARLTGLAASTARAACQRLMARQVACMMVPPA